jgi:hypothetical protein
MNLRRFVQREKKDADLGEGIESHLAHEQDANAARGLSSEEAHRQAHLKFGNPRATRERIWRYRSALARSRLARSALRVAFPRQDARIHGHRHPGDRSRYRREHSSLFGCQHRAAQTDYLP